MRRLLQKATWNPVRDLWETDQTVLLSEHSAAYSETLPPSGMTRNGVLFERPTWEHRTSGPGCSSSPTGNVLLRTPCAAEAEGGPLHPDTARERGQTLRLTGQILAMTGDLLPTPRATEGSNGGPNQRGSSGDLTLSSATVRMLPTPDAYAGSRGGPADPAKLRAAGHQVALADVAAFADFGVYVPAIRRWEQVTGHPAPSPTEPTGRGGAHRLSARFAEWMMGLPPGWVTDIPISRTEQLRAIGNGVVPQQAVAALRDMKAELTNITLAAGRSTP